MINISPIRYSCAVHFSYLWFVIGRRARTLKWIHINMYFWTAKDYSVKIQACWGFAVVVVVVLFFSFETEVYARIVPNLYPFLFLEFTGFCISDWERTIDKVEEVKHRLMSMDTKGYVKFCVFSEQMDKEVVVNLARNYGEWYFISPYQLQICWTK